MKSAFSRTPASLSLRVVAMSALVCAVATTVPSRAGADETLTASTPLAAAAVRLAQPKGVRPRREDPRHFPAFGPISVAGTTYYTYRFEGHVHTQHSRDAKQSTVDILTAAQNLGLDALVITDHGVTDALADFPDYHGTLVPFIGREIGGQFGHAVMWNISDDTLQVPQTTSLHARAEFAHKRGGLLVFAHPGWWIDGNEHNPMEWMTPLAMRRSGVAGDVDAIEIWNGVYRTPLPRLVAAWVKMLEAGVYVPIVGNSDFHTFSMHQIGNAHNIAICDKPDVATCLWSAVRDGRIIVTDGPAAVFTVNDKLPGSILVADGSPLRVDVDALAPEGGTLEVYSGRTVVQKLELQPGIRSKASWQIASPADDSFVRIDILRPHRELSQTPTSLLSNPVLIDVAPARASWR
jgi:hypothetical protein